MHKATKLAVAAAALITLGTPSIANAQNVDPFFFGDEAALGAGAVVASVRDSGALWYNPAGFGGLRRELVSASASTFGVRIRKIPGALRSRVGGVERGVDLSSFDVISVPNAIVAATAIGDRYALAGGLLTTQRDLRSALGVAPDAAAVDSNGVPLTLGQRLDVQTDYAKYHFGAAFAAALSSTLRVGVAAFGTYAKSNANVQYSLSAVGGPNPTDERAFITQSARVTGSTLGTAGSVGIQWEPSSRIAVGLSVRSPEIALSASVNGGATQGIASAGGTEPANATLTNIPPPEVDGAGKLVVPGRALAGVAIALGPPSSWLEFGVDAAHGLPASSVVDAQQPTINGRVGVRYMLSPSWVLGSGVFSDRATLRRIGDFIGSDRVDYYGLTLGVSKRTPLALVQDPQPEALVLVTTLSLRTAAGFGQARAFTIDLDNPAIPRDDRVDVVFYEIMPYLGSAVVF